MYSMLPDPLSSATVYMPTAWFRTIVHRLRDAPQALVGGALGISQGDAGQWDLFVRSFQVMREPEALLARTQGGPRFEIGFVPHTVTRENVWESLAWTFRVEHDPPYPSVCLLQIGTASERGAFTGIFASGDRIVPIRRLHLVGTGMKQFAATDFRQPVRQPRPEEGERWSRLIGALGGAEVWQRLTNLSLTIVGIGRTGSLIAAALARLGCRHVTLIDPDRLELHNVEAMDLVTSAEIGGFKAEVVARQMRELNSHLEVRPLTRSVFSQEAQHALKSAHVIICAVDHQAARLVTGALATVYLKPWLDIGTGVFRGGDMLEHQLGEVGPSTLHLGADVRLILPGDGCLLCWGGVADLSQALRNWGQPQEPRDWRMERAGSLRSLNMLAVATGLRWLEELVMGRLTASIWQRVETNSQGIAEWRVMPRRRDPACRLCAQVGCGDLDAVQGPLL